MESKLIVSDLGRKVKTTWKIWTYDEGGHIEAMIKEYGYGVLDEGWVKPAIIDHNLFLNTGSNAVWQGLMKTLTTAYDNTNARIGVGDSSSAAVATQTGILGTAFYLGMDTSYPILSGTGSSIITFQGTAGTSVGNQAWNEFTVDNGTTSINRVVSAQGTKVSGQIRTIQVQLSLT